MPRFTTALQLLKEHCQPFPILSVAFREIVGRLIRASDQVQISFLYQRCRTLLRVGYCPLALLAIFSNSVLLGKVVSQVRL